MRQNAVAKAARAPALTPKKLEVTRHSRRCGGDDGAVEVLHEERTRNEQRYCPPRRPTAGAEHG
ncbi:MAG TPA: hypothetical protein VN683_11135 [Acidothermaceae bacterium]|nr:hypothetical protein [Acidothermaceae bacterium]